MAQRMKMMLVLACLFVPALADAAGLPDPTRPAIMSDQMGAKAPGVPRVQMIKLGKGRATAVVDGQEVSVGSRLGDMRVVKITDSEVVLKGKRETEVLRLFAEVEKRPTAADGKKIDAGASRKAKK